MGVPILAGAGCIGPVHDAWAVGAGAGGGLGCLVLGFLEENTVD